MSTRSTLPCRLFLAYVVNGGGEGGEAGRGVAKLHMVGALFGGGPFWWGPFLVGAPGHVPSLACPKSSPDDMIA